MCREQRVRFVVEATRGQAVVACARSLRSLVRPGICGCNATEQQGVAGIAERSRSPHHSPRRTAAELERRVIEVRQRYPDWGARKLRVMLAREGVDLPRNTIHRILAASRSGPGARATSPGGAAF